MEKEQRNSLGQKPVVACHPPWCSGYQVLTVFDNDEEEALSPSSVVGMRARMFMVLQVHLCMRAYLCRHMSVEARSQPLVQAVQHCPPIVEIGTLTGTWVSQVKLMNPRIFLSLSLQC